MAKDSRRGISAVRRRGLLPECMGHLASRHTGRLRLFRSGRLLRPFRLGDGGVQKPLRGHRRSSLSHARSDLLLRIRVRRVHQLPVGEQHRLRFPRSAGGDVRGASNAESLLRSSRYDLCEVAPRFSRSAARRNAKQPRAAVRGTIWMLSEAATFVAITPTWPARSGATTCRAG